MQSFCYSSFLRGCTVRFSFCVIIGLKALLAYRTFRVVFIVDEPRVYRAPSAF